VIDTSTGTVKARARFANPSGALFANQFVNVTVLVDTLRSVITVPAVAIRHGPQGDFVYVIQPDSTVTLTLVKVGPAQGETASVLSGLNAGDTVVTEGGDRLSDGAKVIQPKDAARFAQMQARQGKSPGGLLGWIEGLFGAKQQPGAGAGGLGADNTGGQSGAGGQGAARRAALLASLNLSPDQQTKANQIFADARAKAAAAGDDAQARRQAMQDANTQLEAILTPEQKTKFEAARAQTRGAGNGVAGPAAAQSPAPPAAASSAPHRAGPRTAALSAPAAPPPSNGAPAAGAPGGHAGQGGAGRFIDALGLDAAQRAQAEHIFAAARAQAQGSSDPNARRAAMQEAFGKLNAILRPDQKAKLAALRAQGRGGNGGG